MHDVRMPAEAGNGFRFLVKLFGTHAIGAFLVSAEGRNKGIAGAAVGKHVGQILFDGYFLTCGKVVPQIGNAETALAEHMPYHVFAIENGADGQRHRHKPHVLSRVAADGAGSQIGFKGFKTVRANVLSLMEQHKAPLFKKMIRKTKTSFIGMEIITRMYPF